MENCVEKDEYPAGTSTESRLFWWKGGEGWPGKITLEQRPQRDR